jgi:hypothetical protein
VVFIHRGFKLGGVLLRRRVVFWILMGRSFLLRGRELVSKGKFLGRVGILFGGLELRDVFIIMGLGGGP